MGMSIEDLCRFEPLRDPDSGEVLHVKHRRYLGELRIMYFSQEEPGSPVLASDTPFAFQRSNNFMVYSDGINPSVVSRVRCVNFTDYSCDDIMWYEVDCILYANPPGTDGTFAQFDVERAKHIAEGTWRGK